MAKAAGPVNACLAKHRRRRQGDAMRRKARQASKAENRPRFWGRHAVAAALANPERDDPPHLGDARGGGRARP